MLPSSRLLKEKAGMLMGFAKGLRSQGFASPAKREPPAGIAQTKSELRTIGARHISTANTGFSIADLGCGIQDIKGWQ